MAVGMFGKQPDLNLLGVGRVNLTSDGDTLSSLCNGVFSAARAHIFACSDARAFLKHARRWR